MFMENRLILCKYVPVHTAEQIRVHLNTPLPSPESLCHLDIAIVPAGAILLSLSECLEHASSLRNLVRLAAHRGHSGDGLQANKSGCGPTFSKGQSRNRHVAWHGTNIRNISRQPMNSSQNRTLWSRLTFAEAGCPILLNCLSSGSTALWFASGHNSKDKDEKW